jgi:hypothetical protein
VLFEFSGIGKARVMGGSQCWIGIFAQADLHISLSVSHITSGVLDSAYLPGLG